MAEPAAFRRQAAQGEQQGSRQKKKVLALPYWLPVFGPRGTY